MNKIGYVFTLFFIIIIHLLIKQFDMIKNEQKKLIEEYRIKLGLNPSKIPHNDLKKEYTQKNNEFKDYDYKKVNFSEIEDEEGYDIDNDYDLFKEDLLKYIESSNNNDQFEKRTEPVASEKQNLFMNENSINQPLTKKEYIPKGSVFGDMSMDKQYKNAFEKNNKDRNSKLKTKTLKPDWWVYNNEKTINGGFFDEKNGIMPFDNGESTNYVLL